MYRMYRFREKIQLYNKFIKEYRVDKEYYERLIKEAERIINLVETGNLTPEIFNTLNSRDKWDLYCYLKGKCDWYCSYCGRESDDPEGTFGYVECEFCNEILTHRTGGGQSDPFNWTFKWNNKEIRKQKLLKLKI